jgi:transposase
MLSLVLLAWTIVATVVGTRPRRDFAGLEDRRRKAGRLFAKGKTQAEVSRELEVSRQSVSRWYADWQAGGNRALTGAGRAGRMPKLSERQREEVVTELERGPLTHGYPTDMWTLARVAEVIEATTGVSYHPGHVWRILRQMGWSRQRPARRAVERDDEAIARWVARISPSTHQSQDAAVTRSQRPDARAPASTAQWFLSSHVLRPRRLGAAGACPARAASPDCGALRQRWQQSAPARSGQGRGMSRVPRKRLAFRSPSLREQRSPRLLS